MSERSGKTVVTVEIAGDEYTIRADATPDYARECAAYVDRTIAQIRQQGSLIEAHKAVILAALALTDQLFHARAEADALRREITQLALNLVADIEREMATADLASDP